MQRLIIIVLGIAILWSGFWFWGAERNKAGIAAMVTGAEKSGWQVQFEKISQMGFPNRYDVTLRNPQISNAAGTFAWQATFLQIMRLTYTPTHWLIIWPNTHDLTLAGQPVRLISQKLRASVTQSEGAQWRATATAENLTFTTNLGLSLPIENVQISTEQSLKKTRVYVKGTTAQPLNPDLQMTIELFADLRDMRDGKATLSAQNIIIKMNGKTLVSDGVVDFYEDVPPEGWLGIKVANLNSGWAVLTALLLPLKALLGDQVADISLKFDLGG